MADELAKHRSNAPLTEGVQLDTVSQLARLVGDFGSTLDLDQILANVSEGIRDHIQYDTFAVLLLDQLGQQLEFRFAVGYPDDVVRNWRFGLGQGIVGSAAQNRASSPLSSSLARCARPRVQAKIEAIGLVEVSSPRWWAR